MATIITANWLTNDQPARGYFDIDLSERLVDRQNDRIYPRGRFASGPLKVNPSLHVTVPSTDDPLFSHTDFGVWVTIHFDDKRLDERYFLNALPSDATLDLSDYEPVRYQPDGTGVVVGADGRGIAGITVEQADGVTHLVITYDDGETERVLLPLDEITVNPGDVLSIDRVEQVTPGTMTVWMTDGTSVDIELPRGPQGVPGKDGADGAPGVDGKDGAPGPQGPLGPEGPQGPQGLPGTPGADGKDGAVGPQGPEGPQGEQGPQGPQGLPGKDGAPGADGTDGAAGPQGPAGPEGPEGPQGPQGLPGKDGAIGPQGPAGPAGADGIDGTMSFEDLTEEQRESLRGPQGDTGPQGPQGEIGPAGPKGDTGDTGPAGPKGDTGPRGPAGVDGVDGEPGTDGTDGQSALEVWLAQEENAGKTADDFFAALKGETGATGEQGPAGPKGDTGPRGPQGPQGLPGKDGAPGPEGPQGPAGADGKDGVDGAPGADGKDGKDFTYADFTPEQLEALRGPRGYGGRGVESITDEDGDGVATVTYSDGETADLPLPSGGGGGIPSVDDFFLESLVQLDGTLVEIYEAADYDFYEYSMKIQQLVNHDLIMMPYPGQVKNPLLTFASLAAEVAGMTHEWIDPDFNIIDTKPMRGMFYYSGQSAEFDVEVGDYVKVTLTDVTDTEQEVTVSFEGGDSFAITVPAGGDFSKIYEASGYAMTLERTGDNVGDVLYNVEVFSS